MFSVLYFCLSLFFFFCTVWRVFAPFIRLSIWLIFSRACLMILLGVAWKICALFDKTVWCVKYAFFYYFLFNVRLEYCQLCRVHSLHCTSTIYKIQIQILVLTSLEFKWFKISIHIIHFIIYKTIPFDISPWISVQFSMEDICNNMYTIYL